MTVRRETRVRRYPRAHRERRANRDPPGFRCDGTHARPARRARRGLPRRRRGGGGAGRLERVARVAREPPEPRRPALGLLEVRYRVRSWRDMGPCIEDAAAALAAATAAGARQVTLVGFSMGGAVAVSVAEHPLVDQVIGLAPWLPGRLDLTPLRGRRLDVLHGSLDRWFPGVPGVPASLSRAAVERAQALGIEARYRLVRGGVHGIAARTRFGLVRFPKAGRVARRRRRSAPRLENRPVGLLCSPPWRGP